MIRVDQKPADLGESGWNAILQPREPYPALDQDIECDYLVVGAGFAGLSAARRLRQLEADASIVILEAQQVASGPAGRNSGFMIDLPHDITSNSYAGENSRDLRNIRMNRAAIAFAAESVQNLSAPDEIFDPCGKINAAAGTAGLARNESYARHLEALGESCELLDTATMQGICGSDYYQGGLFTPGTAVIQPAAYIRNLATTLAQQDECRVYEDSALIELERVGERWKANTERGSVVSSRVILAVNGLIESFGFYRNRLMHINLYASMTRALSEGEVESLGGADRWGFTPSEPIGSTVRRIDGDSGVRLVIRNRCTYEANLKLPAGRLRRVLQDHEATLYARFPMLKQVEMEYSWSGRLCLSRNDVWALGEVEAGLFSACCQNGLGATRGTIAGIVCAEMASDNSGRSLVPDYRTEKLPRRLFPEPFMSLGAQSVIRFKEWRAGREL